MGLLELSSEIQLCIYGSLRNIDDALHFARTCRYMQLLFQVHRRPILRSIIVSQLDTLQKFQLLNIYEWNAEHHKYDVPLTRSENWVSTFAAKFYNNGQSPSKNSRPRFPSGRQINFCVNEGLTDEALWAIVTRWHAMKVLFNLYCNREVRTYYLRSPLSYEETGDSEWAKALAAELSLLRPSNNDSIYVRKLESSVKRRAYERFYRSLCGHWQMVNMICKAKVAFYETSSTRNRHFDGLWERWWDDPGRDLGEKVDTLEVVDFVWGFLGRKIFPDPGGLPVWLEWDGPERFLDERESALRNWHFFIVWVTQYVRPPHIIELLFCKWELISTKGREGARYLQNLGFLDLQEGHCEYDDEHTPPEAFFEISCLELDGIARLACGHLDDEGKWYNWSDKLKGQVLFRQDDRVIQCLMKEEKKVL